MSDKPSLTAQILPEYEPEIGAALWRLEDARRRTLRLLRDLPTTIIDWDADGYKVNLSKNSPIALTRYGEPS